MKENQIPKWQQELRSFLGIKSGIILEGNVYDEYPWFLYGEDGPTFCDIDNLEQTIISLVDSRENMVFFFDPVDGFYCFEGDKEAQRRAMLPLFEGYSHHEITKNRDYNVCFMPSGCDRDCRGLSAGEAARIAETRKYIWVSEIIRRTMEGSVELPRGKNIVFVLNFASRMDMCNIRQAEANTMFMNLMAAMTYGQCNPMRTGTVIMVVDKYNDIPAWMYLNNPNIRTISLCVPERNTRRLYLEHLRGNLAPYSILSQEDYDPGRRFVAETEGMRLQEIRQILQLAYKKHILPEDISLAFRLYKYGVLDNPWEHLEQDILVNVERKLEERVKGQQEALTKVKAVVTRAVTGLSGMQHSASSRKPRGILFFSGPTGVGKTETAKALAESVFGDENACIRFDMSEYRQEHSDQKLFGAPPGYVGYEGGGQLTNAVKNRPFSILLFDEIEKAHTSILEKFLQILEDGRMTDSQGNTVYFGETIIIFTSNLGMTKAVSGSRDGSRVPTITIEDPHKEDTPQFRQRVTDVVSGEVKRYFTDIGRPELLNRVGEDNIVVFQFINKSDAEVICRSKLQKICEALRREKSIDVLTDNVEALLCRKAVQERSNGGRGIGNMLEREFLNPLAGVICTRPGESMVLRCHEVEEKVVFEVMTE